MADEVTVPFDENSTDNAVLLLAAAAELDLDPGVVRTVEGGFVVPQEVHDKAFKKSEPAKKAPAKKAPAKKKAE